MTSFKIKKIIERFFPRNEHTTLYLTDRPSNLPENGVNLTSYSSLREKNIYITKSADELLGENYHNNSSKLNFSRDSSSSSLFSNNEYQIELSDDTASICSNMRLVPKISTKMMDIQHSESVPIIKGRETSTSYNESCNETNSRIIENIYELYMKYQNKLQQILDECYSEVYKNHIRQNDIVIVHAKEDENVAIVLEKSLKARRPGIRVINFMLPGGSNKIESWDLMLSTANQKVVIMSQALKSDPMLELFFPEILYKDGDIIPVYLDEDFKNDLPSPFNLVRPIMPIEEVYNHDPIYWARVLDNSNARNHVYPDRYWKELKRIAQIYNNLQESRQKFQIDHSECCSIEYKQKILKNIKKENIDLKYLNM